MFHFSFKIDNPFLYSLLYLAIVLIIITLDYQLTQLILKLFSDSRQFAVTAIPDFPATPRQIRIQFGQMLSKQPGKLLQFLPQNRVIE